MVRQTNENVQEDGHQQTFKVQYKRKPVSLLPPPQNIGENQEVWKHIQKRVATAI